MHEAWKLYDELYIDAHVGFVEEPNEIETNWRMFTQSSLPSTNVWSDAYLAAFALTVDFEIVTFDHGLAQYRDLKRTILS